MTAGMAYAIVVDGYGGKFGQYQIDITARQVCQATFMVIITISALICLCTVVKYKYSVQTG